MRFNPKPCSSYRLKRYLPPPVIDCYENRRLAGLAPASQAIGAASAGAAYLEPVRLIELYADGKQARTMRRAINHFGRGPKVRH